MRGWLLICLSLLLWPWTAGAQVIKVAGSTTVEAYMVLAAEAFKQKHPEIRIDVTGGGSGVGVARASDNSVHIGMSSRELKPEEIAELKGVTVVPVGIDAVAVIVSQNIYEHYQLHSLTVEKLAAIYRGEIRGWQDVGGPNRPILVVDKELERGTRQVFVKYLFGDALAPSPDSAVVVGSNHHMRDIVRASDQAIGYVSVAELSGQVSTLGLQLGDRIIRPTIDAMKQGRYPLSRKLYLLVRDDAPHYVQDFVDFATSPEAEPILHEAGYLPLNQD